VWRVCTRGPGGNEGVNATKLDKLQKLVQETAEAEAWASSFGYDPSVGKALLRSLWLRHVSNKRYLRRMKADRAKFDAYQVGPTLYLLFSLALDRPLSPLSSS